MLSYDEIKSAIDGNEIQIFYSFKKDLSFLSDEVSFNDSEFKSNLYSDKLKLTLGPVLQSHKKRHIKSKTRFKDFQNCIDIRKNNNKYILKPQESITVLTNERVTFNGCYSALILPKVSLSQVGIVVTSAYIEPYYNGLLRLLITNTSDYSFELKTLEVIADCYFFKFPEAVPEIFKNTFPQKSAFYGQNWKIIMEEDKEPFPTKKSPFFDSVIGKILFQLRNIWYFLKEYSFTTTIITLFIGFLVGFGAIKEQYKKLINDVKNNTLETEKLKENLKENFQGQKSEIVIPKGQKTGQKSIKVKISKGEIISILCTNDLIHYKIYSGEMENESTIIFSYELKEKANNDATIEFEYTILKILK